MCRQVLTSLQPLPYAPRQFSGVVWRPHFDVVIEIQKYVARHPLILAADPVEAGGLGAARPGRDPIRPCVERGGVVAGGIQLLDAMQPAIDEITRQIAEPRPHRRIGADQRDVVGAQQVDEFDRTKTLVADFQRMAQLSGRVGPRPVPPIEPCVVAPGERGRRFGVMRQHGEERREPFAVEAQVGRELPQDRSQLSAEAEDARGEKVGDRRFRLTQPPYVGDEAGRLDGEHEIVRHCISPGGEALRPLEAVECAVDFDGAELAGGKRQFLPLRQLLRIEHAAPWRIGPPRNADADVAGPFHGLTRSICPD